MPVSVHVADVGLGAALRLVAQRPKDGSRPGLLHADIALAKPLGGGTLPKVQVGRVCLIASWGDDAALDRFLADDPLADALAGGWRARLEPLRAFGSWPGVPDDLPRKRSVDHEGPAVVLTFGQARALQFPRFLRATAKAEDAAVVADGLRWGTAMARPPFLATCSVWESTEAVTAYAYGAKDQAHQVAMTADRAKPFHHRSAFVRFHPVELTGHLSGRNPTPASPA